MIQDTFAASWLRERLTEEWGCRAKLIGGTAPLFSEGIPKKKNTAVHHSMRSNHFFDMQHIGHRKPSGNSPS